MTKHSAIYKKENIRVYGELVETKKKVYIRVPAGIMYPVDPHSIRKEEETEC
ncbi:hypothetical protein [Macrococcus bovicus]|uniref:hypothetical protein n=1 Tax=Macrococcus bovicus TaxID=69968 RepID=UPI00140DB22F|nr:hypothetical protein [Macrococcus bovicus]